MSGAGPGWKIGTRCVRGKEQTTSSMGEIAPPIYQTSAFAFDSVSQIEEYNRNPESHFIYTRYANPTLRAAESWIASLESGEEAVILASGQAATAAALLSLVKSGDEILAASRIYGGTRRLLEEVLGRLGIVIRFFGTDDLGRLDALLTSRTRVLFVETPTNPGLDILDISSLAATAHRAGVALVADNTFATPCNQNPLFLGADLVVHSGTKYLGGHSDLMAGVVVGSRARIAPVREAMKLTGGCADPLAAFLLLRGMKTLAVRVRAHNDNAGMVSAYLAGHSRISRVYYPGLESHPGHAVARRQMRGFGGIVTFEPKGGFESARRVLDRFQVFLRAATLGGVESNAMIPVLASHVGFSDEALVLAGVSRGMIRLSVGIEDPDDLLADLEQALC